MKKLIFFSVGILLMINLVSAADVAYIVVNDYSVKSEFTDALNRLSLTYDIVKSNEVSSYDFGNCRLILLNDDYFTNWNEIPVNEVSALIVNGRNIVNWGWTKRITVMSQDEPISINLNTTHEIRGDLPFNVPAYTSISPDIYYLDGGDAYNGLEIIASNTYDSEDAIIAVAHKGTNLTRGSLVTEINANGVFFGIKETDYWTDEARQLFDNSLMWLYGEDTFHFNIKEGNNLISFPLIIDYTSAQLKNENPEIISIKEDYNNNFLEATNIQNNKGYFVESSDDFILTIEGSKPRESQTIQLYEGMNLVGITSLSNINLNSLPGEVIEVSKRGNDGTYEIATKYFFGWWNGFELEPGEGYWFKLNADTVWEYNP